MKLLYANDSPGVHAPSWYRDTCKPSSYPDLDEHLHTDVCIIGAGLTGLSAALELRAQNIDCVVLDAHRVGWGASGRNGGQLGTGFNMDQMQLESLMGPSLARALWDIAEQAKRWIFDTCQHHHIDIEYQAGIVYAQHRARFVKPLHDYCSYLNKHYAYSDMQALDTHAIAQRVNSENYHGGAVDLGAGHINPLKLVQGLAHASHKAGAELRERSEVIAIHTASGRDTQRVVTATGSVSCQRIILATNGYVDALDKRVNQKLMPINNFIVVTQPLGKQAVHLLPYNDAVADSRFVVNYFRRVAEDRLLFGGGENYSYQFPLDIASLVRRAMLDIFPTLHDVAIDYAWGGTLAITRNRLPFIGELQRHRYTAGGYSGHGVALACIYGKALAGHLAGNSELYDVLGQCPNKHFPGGMRSRSVLLATAMTAYSWLDRL